MDKFNLKIIKTIVFLSLVLTGLPIIAQDKAQEVGKRSSDGLTADEIITRLTEADRSRYQRLKVYSSIRNYSMVNQRFKKSARMQVKVAFQHPDQFEFEVVEEEGPGAVRNQVFRKMLQSEQEALNEREREKTQLTLQNYDVELIREELLNGRRCYILSASPRTKNKFLYRGEVWIDAQDFALARIEGAPAQKPSFWVRKTKFVHLNQKVGDFWVPLSNHSRTEVLIFGSTDVEIHYGDYEVNQFALR